MIEVTDRKTNHVARIKVPEELLQRAQMDTTDPSNEASLTAISGARDHICMQARIAMRHSTKDKRPRHAGYLDWDHIRESIKVVATPQQMAQKIAKKSAAMRPPKQA